MSNTAKREPKVARWTETCSGCCDTEDGHLVGYYPWDKKAQCYVGAGCHECGYTGKRRREWRQEWQEAIGGAS